MSNSILKPFIQAPLILMGRLSQDSEENKEPKISFAKITSLKSFKLISFLFLIQGLLPKEQQQVFLCIVSVLVFALEKKVCRDMKIVKKNSHDLIFGPEKFIHYSYPQ